MVCSEATFAKLRSLHSSSQDYQALGFEHINLVLPSQSWKTKMVNGLISRSEISCNILIINELYFLKW